MDDTILRLKGVRVTYGTSHTALDVDELSFSEGEHTALVGPSGSGKTTLLRLVNGYVPADAGEVELFGRSIPARELSARRQRKLRRRVGFVFQGFNLIERASVLQNVLWGRLGEIGTLTSLLGRFDERDLRLALEAIEEVGLGDRPHQRADTLSGGQQQRVGIARVIAQEAELILADEPLSNLDPRLAGESLQLLLDVASEHDATLITSLHQPELARRFADRIVGMRGGRVVWEGPAARFDEAAEETVYGDTVVPTRVPREPRNSSSTTAGRQRPGPPAATGVATEVSADADDDHPAAPVRPATPADPHPSADRPRRHPSRSSSGAREGEATEADASARRRQPRASWLRTLGRGAALLGAVLVVAWSWQGTNFDLGRLAGSLDPLTAFLGRMVPPDTTVFETVVTSTSETMQIAFLGTFLAMLASFPLGVGAAVNLAPDWLNVPIRGLLGLLRGIPILLLALMFVAAIGLGPFPGVLAVAVHSVGMLAKFYGEAFENARAGAIEALDSAGASWLQRLRFAVLPQVAPDLARDTLFRLELNIRESLVLGLVGAGGIGFYIQLYIRSFQYRRVATLTLVVLVLVLVVEQGSMAIRRRLR